MYRAFILEIVAVLDGTPECHEINIVGDGVWGVFDGQYKAQVDKVLECAAKVSTLLEVLNDKLIARGYDRLYVGMGLDWGRSLMIKSGFYGSGVNEVVYMGSVVNSAAKLCSYGETETGLGYRRSRVMAGRDFVSNLASKTYSSFFAFDNSLACYQASIHNTMMDEWRQRSR